MSEQPPTGGGPEQPAQPGSQPPPPPQYGQPGQPQYQQPQYQQPQYGQPGYYPPPPPPTPGKATAALVMGIAGLVLCPLILSIPAWIVGHSAVKEIDASNGSLGGRSTANAGYILGIIGTVIGVLLVVGFIIVIAAVPDSCTSTTSDNGNGFSFHCS